MTVPGDAPTDPRAAQDLESPRRTRRIVLLALTATLLLGTGIFAHQVLTVEHAVSRARAALTEGRALLEQGDADQAVARFERLVAEVDRAAAASGGPVWAALARVPVLGRSVRPARATIDVADRAAELAAGILRPLTSLRSADGTSTIRTEDGGFDMDVLEAVANDVLALDAGPLEAGLAELAEVPADRALTRVRQGRTEVLERSAELLSFAEDAQAMADVLPEFLGADEPREYFLAMQNSGELRGTGGLIGFFATIRIDRGRLSLGDPERYEVLDQTDITDDADPPLPDGVDPAYLTRYGRTGATVFLGNANLDPDLPTTAKVMLGLYERERGRQLDGVLVLDPIGLAYIHAPIGPVTVPEDVLAPGIPASIEPGQLAPLLMIGVYDELGGASPLRKAFLAAVAESAFRNVAAGGWGVVDMLRRVSQTAGAGHLQVYSTRPDEQAVFEDLGVAGALRAPEGTDFLAITANNAAGNKSDVHVAHRFAVDITLGPGTDASTVRRTRETVVSVVNPLDTTGHDIYIIGSSEPGRGFIEAFTGPLGLNRTWFTVWGPQTDEGHVVVDPDGRTIEAPYVTSLHGLDAVDHTMETPARSVRSFRTSRHGQVTVEPTAEGLVYRFRLHRQSKAIPDRVQLRFSVAPGWHITRTAVEGGGADPGFGPDGEPGPVLQATLVDDVVTVYGDVTRPVTVELHVQVPRR